MRVDHIQMTRSIAHYEMTGTLGEGGMGIVYAARDPRLDRTVALKMIRRGGASPMPPSGCAVRRGRPRRSTIRTSASCTTSARRTGELFIAMEYLEGESLAARLERGPLPLDEAVQIALAALSALDALHARGLIHRDLKPSNIFLTPHGVKLLDFGLALRDRRRRRGNAADDARARCSARRSTCRRSRSWASRSIARGDLFAAGAVLYEMLTGRPPFGGASVPANRPRHRLRAPAGARRIAGDRRDRPRDPQGDREASAGPLRLGRARWPTTCARRCCSIDSGSDLPQPSRPMTRLIVLPFRVLRADPEIDFLAFSLSDALTTSLSGLDSLVVRSSLTAAALRRRTPSISRRSPSKADVDAVLTGTLLRAGDQLRVTTQLAEVPGGTVRWSQTTQVRLGDIFQLQDALTSRIVESLAVPLSARDERALKRDVPASAKAYEFYLRANQIAYESRNWTVARDLYRQCLEEDPAYAPAWARLARIYRRDRRCIPTRRRRRTMPWRKRPSSARSS